MYSGGQGVYLAALCREYVRMGHEVHAVVGPPYPELDQDVVQHRLPGYSVFHQFDAGEDFWRQHPLSYLEPVNFYELAASKAGMFSVMAAFSMRAFKAVAGLHRQTPFDIVHDNQSLGYGDLLIKLLGVPVVANIHHPLSVDRRNAMAQARGTRAKIARVMFYPFHMQHVVARGVDRIVTGSKASAQAVGHAFRLKKDHIAPILDGVDTDRFHPAEVQREPGRILFVGNSDDRNKGVRYLVEALARLGAHDWRLFVVDRKEATVAMGRARELGLENKVALTGRLTADELADEYRAAAVFVSPSLYEGFGLPAAEAQACGAPVVATTAGALPEVVLGDETGLLVPPADSPALAHAIGRLLEDRPLAALLGEAAHQRVERELTWTRTAERTIDLYREVITARRGATRR
jgi:MMP alpha-(1->4)-mannosyltransferase